MWSQQWLAQKEKWEAEEQGLTLPERLKRHGYGGGGGAGRSHEVYAVLLRKDSECAESTVEVKGIYAEQHAATAAAYAALKDGCLELVKACEHNYRDVDGVVAE